jgi:hypothetical protein
MASGTGGDGPLSGQADFTVRAGQIVVALTNTLGASLFVSQGQALSQITFAVTNLSGMMFTTTGSGSAITITNGGTTPASADPNRWKTTGSTTLQLTALSGGKPQLMIAPGGGNYPNIHPNFANNGFNPYFDGSATFTITIPNLPANSRIGNVVFGFGTGPDTSLPGTNGGGAAPAPSSMIITLTGLAILGLTGLSSAFRRRKVVPA